MMLPQYTKNRCKHNVHEYKTSTITGMPFALYQMYVPQDVYKSSLTNFQDTFNKVRGVFFTLIKPPYP